jgi:protein-L-isoaspartate(D-aspartate) O-methyltransferase
MCFLRCAIKLHKLIHLQEQGLTDMSISNLRKDKYSTLLDSGDVEIITGDGRKGYPPAAPFDVIHVGAAAPNKPNELIEQLKNGGRMFVPVGTQMQDVWLYDKDENGKVKEEKLFG